MHHSDFQLVSDSSWSYLLTSLSTRVPIFCMVFSLFATVVCGAPATESVSLLHLSKMKMQGCTDQVTTSFSSPLLISLHLAFYRPASPVVCRNHASIFNPVVQSPNNSSQQQLSSRNANGQPGPLSFEHPFWDRENDLLFAAVGASRTLDYFSTLNFRRRGRNEALLTNDIVDNHGAFASLEAAATVASIGVSYLFHRSHHHRLERWTSIVHASLATSGAVRNYCLQTVHR